MLTNVKKWNLKSLFLIYCLQCRLKPLVPYQLYQYYYFLISYLSLLFEIRYSIGYSVVHSHSRIFKFRLLYHH